MISAAETGRKSPRGMRAVEWPTCASMMVELVGFPAKSGTSDIHCNLLIGAGEYRPPCLTPVARTSLPLPVSWSGVVDRSAGGSAIPPDTVLTCSASSKAIGEESTLHAERDARKNCDTIGRSVAEPSFTCKRLTSFLERVGMTTIIGAAWAFAGQIATSILRECVKGGMAAVLSARGFMRGDRYPMHSTRITKISLC
jgi:hypothetical protein